MANLNALENLVKHGSTPGERAAAKKAWEKHAGRPWGTFPPTEPRTKGRPTPPPPPTDPFARGAHSQAEAHARRMWDLLNADIPPRPRKWSGRQRGERAWDEVPTEPKHPYHPLEPLEQLRRLLDARGLELVGYAEPEFAHDIRPTFTRFTPNTASIHGTLTLQVRRK